MTDIEEFEVSHLVCLTGERIEDVRVYSPTYKYKTPSHLLTLLPFCQDRMVTDYSVNGRLPSQGPNSFGLN